MESRLPIAIALTSFDRGGTERQMTELIRRLDRARFDVHVVCFRREGAWLRHVEDTAPVTEFRLGSFASPRAARQFLRLARWLRERQVAVMHACDLYANCFALPAAALGRVPVRIGSRRGIVSPTAQRRLLVLQRAGYAAAHRVVANSAAAAARLRHEGLPDRRVTVIPNGLDLQAFHDAATGPSTVITTVANLRGGKGHEILLEAVARAAGSHPDVRVQFVGDGPRRAALEDQCRTLGIAGRVAFLGQRDDVAGILRGSGLFVLPSFMEAFPNSVMEAMACGLPVIASAVGGIPELVTDGHTGLLVPPGEPAALAAAIVRLLDDRALAARLGAAARSTVQSRFSFERMTRSFEALYASELSARGLIAHAGSRSVEEISLRE